MRCTRTIVKFAYGICKQISKSIRLYNIARPHCDVTDD